MMEIKTNSVLNNPFIIKNIVNSKIYQLILF